MDATYALEAQPAGVGRYSERLICELARTPEMELTLCARWPLWLRLGRHLGALGCRRCLLQEPLNIRLPGRVDLFHGLNQRLPGYRFRRQVVTLHDLFPLTGARYSTPDFQRRFSLMIADAVARADRVICVSAYTREQAVGRLGVPRERCAVVPHGVEQQPEPPSERARQRARQLAGGAPFLLSVGAIQVRKNNVAAARVAARLGGAARLVIAGGAGHGADEFFDFVRGQGLSDRVRVLGYVDEQTLNALYAEAVALLFPSLEEGFGMPVLEAMARGLPVIASNVSSIPEIAGDAAMLFHPDDIEGMAEAARRLLDDPRGRQEWAVRGRARARCFTWLAAAQATVEIYRSLLSGEV